MVRWYLEDIPELLSCDSSSAIGVDDIKALSQSLQLFPV